MDVVPAFAGLKISRRVGRVRRAISLAARIGCSLLCRNPGLSHATKAFPGSRRARSGDAYALRLAAFAALLPLTACAANSTSQQQPTSPTGAPADVTAAGAQNDAPAQGASSNTNALTGNPMRPGLWEFTRAGGMAANSLGKFCLTLADLSDPRSRVNGYLAPEEKRQCEHWSIAWQGASAQYDGLCKIRGNNITIKGSITASAEYYSDEQQQARDESGFARAVKDIINGRRIGDC